MVDLLELYNTLDSKEYTTDEISVRDFGSTFLISSNAALYCITSVGRNCDRGPNVNCIPMPYKGKKLIKMDNLISLESGCLYYDSTFDEKYNRIILNTVHYKYLDAHLSLPSGSKMDYGVVVPFVGNENEGKRYVENDQFTRRIFGMTYSELNNLIDGYAEVFNTGNSYNRYPRITKSGQRDNYCDLTNAWIPKGFPYITFAESDYDFSHVSLYGFYRYMQLLSSRSIRSPLSNALRNSGVHNDIIEILNEISVFGGQSRQVLSRDIGEV